MKDRKAKKSGRSAVVVGAHHDDNELIAGTLWKLRNQGWRIVSIVLTNGIWIRGNVAEQHVAIRERESRSAARLVGMECVFLRFPEGDFHNTFDSRMALVEQFRRVSPDLVITHPPDDYHIDHIETSRCVWEAVMICSNPCVKTASSACRRPVLYYRDAWYMPFTPDEYVDVSAEMELKEKVLRCHESQLPAEGDEDESMIDLVRLQNRLRGVESGVQFAEGFRRPKLPGNGMFERILP